MSCSCLVFLWGLQSETSRFRNISVLKFSGCKQMTLGLDPTERDSRWPGGRHRCLGCVMLCSCAPASFMLVPVLVFADLAACLLSQIYFCLSFSAFPDIMPLMISSPVVSAGRVLENVDAVEGLFFFLQLLSWQLLFSFDTIF